MPTIVPNDEPTDPTLAALGESRRLMWLIHDLARSIEKLEALPDHYKALAATLVKLSGLRPHRIVGEAGPADAAELGRNLEAIALAVDPLIEAYGAEAASNFNGVDRNLYDNVVRDSIEGFALFDLEEAGRRKAEELHAFRARRGASHHASAD